MQPSHVQLVHALSAMGKVAAMGIAGVAIIAATAAVSPAVAGAATVGYVAVGVSSAASGFIYYRPPIAAADVAALHTIALHPCLFSGHARRIGFPGLRARRVAL